MKILNFGSLNIDYVYGVDHFVQKGETLLSERLNVYGGGKGLNQSIALSRAKTEVYHAGAIGTDGIILVEILRNMGVDTQFVKTIDNVRSGNAIIQNDKQGDNCIILYGGANQAITKKMVDEVIKKFDEGDWIILQNEISEVPYIVEKACKKKMKIVLNPSPINEKIYEIDLNLIDCLILNEGEAQALAGKQSDEYILLEKLKEKVPHADIVLTLGEKGAIYAGKEGITKQQAYKVNVVDTTAAGDTFTGYFLAEIANNNTIEGALSMAAKASAIAVSRRGAAPSIPDWDEVYEFKKIG